MVASIAQILLLIGELTNLAHVLTLGDRPPTEAEKARLRALTERANQLWEDA